MTVAECSRVIPASPEAVFDFLHDYERRVAWDPFLRRADLLEGAERAGPGVKTLCVARWQSGGMGMVTEYVSFDRPRVAAVRMTRGPWFLARFAASIRQIAVAPGRTRVIYKFSFVPRPRWARPILIPVFRWIFVRETEARLRALARQFESR